MRNAPRRRDHVRRPGLPIEGQTGMSKEHDWAVSLEGDPFDLEDARDLFGAGEEVVVCTIRIPPDRTPTALMADEFQGVGDAFQVIETSRRIVDALNGILFI